MPLLKNAINRKMIKKIFFALLSITISQGYSLEEESLFKQLKQSTYAKSGGLLISDGKKYQMIPGKGFGLKTAFKSYRLDVSGSYANRKRHGQAIQRSFLSLQFPKVLLLQASGLGEENPKGSLFYGLGANFTALEFSVLTKELKRIKNEHFYGFSGSLACGYEFFPGPFTGSGQLECSIPFHALNKSPEFSSYPLFEFSLSLGY